MKAYQKLLGLTLAVGLLAVPAYSWAEVSSATPAGELTLADFQRMGNKPIQAWEQYRQYKYRLAHPAPQPTLDASRMRAENGELTLADFQRTTTKPWIANEEYKQYKFRQEHPVKSEPYVAGPVLSGKPSIDAPRIQEWKRTHAQ